MPGSSSSSAMKEALSSSSILLDTNDIYFLHDNFLTLRHNSKSQIEKEAHDGGTGDALAIAASFNLELSPSQLQEGIKNFVATNYSCFEGENSAYSLIDKGERALLPYDINAYHGIGKCGTSQFNADHVKAIIVRENGETWTPDTIYLKIISQIKKMSLEYHKNNKKPNPQQMKDFLDRSGWNDKPQVFSQSQAHSNRFFNEHKQNTPPKPQSNILCTIL